MDIDGKLQRVGMQKDELRAHIEIHRDGIYCRHNLADKETGTDMDGPAETSRQIDKQGGRAGRASTKAVERGGGGRTAGAQGRLFFESTRDQRGRLHGGAGGGTRCYRRARGRGGKGGGGWTPTPASLVASRRRLRGPGRARHFCREVTAPPGGIFNRRLVRERGGTRPKCPGARSS